MADGASGDGVGKKKNPLAEQIAAAKAAEPIAPVTDDAVEPAPAASRSSDVRSEAGEEKAASRSSDVRSEAAPPTVAPPKPVDDEKADRDSVRRALRSKGGRRKAQALARAYGWTAEKFEKFCDTEARKAEEKVRRMREDAGEGSTAGDPPSSAAGEVRDGSPPKKEQPPIKPLPDNSPVRPLGVLGSSYFYLNHANELIEMDAKDHAAAGLRDLFRGTHGLEFLWNTWPKFNQVGNRSGFDASKAADTMIAACADKGVKDVFQLLRGQGVWRDDEGGLALHCGDAIFYKGEWRRPDLYDDHIYPAKNRSVRPAETSEGVEAGAKETLAIFDTWRWRALNEGREDDWRWNGYKMPSIVLLGFVAAAMFGGALEWRPMIWITGDWGGGKSTFLDLVSHLLGGDLVKAADATPAGVWTVLGPSTRPVLLDEVENDPANSRNKQLVMLARKAASGDVILRGSADHKSASFQARSAFLFSSIIHPPMHGQDQSRFTIFDVAKQEGVTPLKLDPVRMGQIGRLIRARIVENWARWPETLAIWSASLGEIGHQAREQKQYGTLLAMFDMIMGREIFDTDSRREFCSQFPVSKTKAPSNAESFLQFVLSIGLDMKSNGIQMTIYTLISAVSGIWNARKTKIENYHAFTADELREAEAASSDGPPVSESTARDQLEARGIFVRRVDGEWRVIIPNQHEGFRRLVNHSEWRGDPGTAGGWAQALRRLDGAKEVNSRKIGGRGWSVPLKVFLMEDEQ